MMAIPGDGYVVQKEAEKKIKFKGLCLEITTNVAYEMYDYIYIYIYIYKVKYTCPCS